MVIGIEMETMKIGIWYLRDWREENVEDDDEDEDLSVVELELELELEMVRGIQLHLLLLLPRLPRTLHLPHHHKKADM
jgi:hypothetical protein